MRLVDHDPSERTTAMSHSDRTLKEFLGAFVEEHALTSGGELVLDVSPEEIQALGDFFVRGLCGWMLGLDIDRRRAHRLVEVTENLGACEEDPCGEDVETPGGDEPIN
jgi:hypothetical protein